MVSDPVGQAVESFHTADGMFHQNAGSCMLPVMFYLGGGQFWMGVAFGFPRPFVRQVYVGFDPIILFRPLEPEVEPQIHLVEPF